MNLHNLPGQEVAKTTGTFLVHFIVMVVGLVMMVAGVGMGVTLVMLPVGVPVGIAGLLVFLWGLFGWSQGRTEVT